MLNDTDLADVLGSTVYSGDGDKIGKVGQVFLDDETGRPEWVTVQTGLFGTNESFVPLEAATFDGDELRVPYSKDRVKDAPNVEVEAGHLDQSEERDLYDYYGLPYGSTSRSDQYVTGSGYETGPAASPSSYVGTTGADYRETETTTGRGSAGTTDDAMTRSEERLRVGDRGQESTETGRAGLRKYVTTETETVEVPVRKERAVVEREPVTASTVDEATSGPDITEAEHEVTLHEERPVVQKVTEPVERVRLRTETQTEQERVSEQVRKEQIEVEGDAEERR